MLFWLVLAIYLTGVNFVTWHTWVHDKRRSVTRGRRTPEKTLLWLCFLGGWPSALLAAKQFRHKTVKASFLGRMYGVILLEVVLVAVAIVLWVSLSR